MKRKAHNGKDLVEIDFNGLCLEVVKSTWEAVSPKNKDTILEYDKSNKRKNKRNETRVNHLRFLIRMGQQKPFKDMTREDVNSFIDSLKVKASSRVHYATVISVFFKWLHDDESPVVIKDLKGIKGKPTRIKYSELVTEEEIQKLISKYENPQQKAIVAVLYDSGCRVGELVNLNRKDVVNTNGMWSISVDGKTGIRNVPLNLSAEYFMPWFDVYHPAKENPNAPLWVSRSYRDKNKPVEERRLGRNAVWRIIKQGERMLGNGKKLKPHLMRHSRLQNICDKGLPENMMRDIAGWVPGSNMPAIYLHSNPNGAMQKLREIDGNLEPEEQIPKRHKLLPIECPRCHTKNGSDSKYCSKCWMPLDLETSMSEIRMLEFMRSPMFKSLMEEATKFQKKGKVLPSKFIDPRESVKMYDVWLERLKETDKERYERVKKEMDDLANS